MKISLPLTPPTRTPLSFRSIDTPPIQTSHHPEVPNIFGPIPPFPAYTSSSLSSTPPPLRPDSKSPSIRRLSRSSSSSLQIITTCYTETTPQASCQCTIL